MKRVLFLMFFALWAINALFAQTNAEIKRLEEARKAIQEQIKQSETLLSSTKKDVGSQLSSLNLLTSQINERRNYIQTIERDVAALNRETVSLERQLKELQGQLEDRKKKYESSVQYMYSNRTIQEKLMFIFSAKTLAQTYRRMRYMQEYADFQRAQGEEIVRKQNEIKAKRQELEEVRKAKTQLLKDSQQEREKLEQQEKEQKTLVASLQKKQKGLQDEIGKKRKEADRLNAQIDKLIEAEIEAARKRAEEEARREAEAARKAAEAQARKESEAKGEQPSSATPPPASKPAPTAPMKEYKLDKADRQLSDNFIKNRGILPMPITGPHIIVSRYGQYAVEGLRNVKLDNKGIDIQGKEGAMARAIFDGEVSAIFQYNNGLIGVLVRHGNYISVYCNLSSASVKKGDKVKTKDVLGKIHDNGGRPLLHFQLRRETEKLNPELWLDK